MRCLPAKNRGAFALIELFVILGIAGTVAAIVLPGLQAGREKNRRIECSDRLRLLANAAILYSNEHRDSVFANTPGTGAWNVQRLAEPAYQAITQRVAGYRIDCPGLYPYTVPGLVPKAGGRGWKDGSTCIGYNYLGGIENLPAKYGWISPLKTSESGDLPLFTDANNYGDDIRPWAVVPHRKNGPGRVRGSTYMWLDWYLSPPEYGAEGGNVATLSGTVTWLPISKMQPHNPIDYRDVLSVGYW